MPFLVRSNLQKLIIVLAFLSTFISVTNMFFVSSHVQKEALLQGSLEIHENYAMKLAKGADSFLARAQSELSYAAQQIGTKWPNLYFMKLELQRLAQQNNTFDSLIIFNKEGVATVASDNAIELTNQIIKSPAVQASLQAQAPLITPPYESTLNNLIIMISHPFFDYQGEYLGFIAGGIYLKENDSLNEILGEHYHKDDSYTYVVDDQKRFLYHPKQELLGQISKNAALDQLLILKNGHRVFENAVGVEMLGGFATIPTTNWLVISQRPAKSALRVHEGLMVTVFFKSLPISVLVLLVIWGLAWLLSNPLRQLAQQAKSMHQTSTVQHVQKINTWYFEANELKKAFLTGLQSVHKQVGQLKTDTRTDVLTGLSNRRALESTLARLTKEETPFVILVLDIDHFKQVNDTYGHLVGDAVLKELAAVLLKNIRAEDYCVRFGGEEFVILLPNCPLLEAQAFAERLCFTVSQHRFPSVDRLTISGGIAAWPLHARNTQELFHLADEMLYFAKQNGRNQVQVAS